MSFLLVCAVIAMIVAFSNPGSKLFASVAAVDPGPLSSAHAGFIGSTECQACHDAHLATGTDWWSRILTPHDNDAQCLECHTFNGPARLAHNRAVEPGAQPAQPTCGTCHKEHKGSGFDAKLIADAKCGNCHQQRFTSFADGHPAFPAGFPYREPNAINFDHSSHFSQHFDKTAANQRDDNPAVADFAERASRDCTACHEIETATREVKPGSFARTCANCHNQQVRERPLKLLLSDYLPPAGSMLMGPGDEEQEEARFSALLESMSESGLGAFETLLTEWQIERGPEILAGLTPEILQAVAVAWSDQSDYEPPESEVRRGGWIAGEDGDGEQSLRYQPTEHADPVMRAWLEVVTRLAYAHPDEERREKARETLEALLDPFEGPGACGKCHAAGITSADAREGRSSGWGYRGSVERHHTTYAHAPHLNLLGRGEACRNCHQLDPKADYKAYFEDANRTPEQFASNFSPIEKSTCDSCHKPSKVRYDCQLCHIYHREPSFNVTFKINRLSSNQQ